MHHKLSSKGLSEQAFDDQFSDTYERADSFDFSQAALISHVLGSNHTPPGQGNRDSNGNGRWGESSWSDEVNDVADGRGGGRGGGGGDKPGKGRGRDKGDKGEDDGSTDDGANDSGTVDSGTGDSGTGDGSVDVGDGGAGVGDEGAGDGGTGAGETNPGTTDPSYYTSGMDTPDGYNVTIHFNGSWSDAAKQGMANAAEMISDIITGDIASFNGIDDILIQAYNEPIDGSGNVLAQGGWIQLRSDPMRLVAEGGIRVDSSDLNSMLNNGTFEDAVFHEMLHAMGFGTTWAMTGLTADIGGRTRFIGENAIEAYNAFFPEEAAEDEYSLLGVPMSNDDAHWAQGYFGDEVMSPNLGTDEFVSAMTVAALEDMGYETIYNVEDMFA